MANISESMVYISEFLERDAEKIVKIIENHPTQIPVPVIAELFGCSQDTLRTALQEQGLLGIAERKAGKLNRGFVVPTAHFVRWYMCQWRY